MQEYRRSRGKIFTTTDDHEYVKSKITGNYIFLGCVLLNL